VNDARLVTAYPELLPQGIATDPSHLRLIADLDALYRAPQPSTHRVTSFDALLAERQRQAPAAAGPYVPAASSGPIPLHGSELPIPLPTRPGWRWALRQGAKVTAAVAAFVLVGALLVLFFRSTSNHSAMPVPAPAEDTPTPVIQATPVPTATTSAGATATAPTTTEIDALIAGLPAEQIGCSATPPRPPTEAGRGYEVQGVVLAGQGDESGLWALYFTLDSASPETIRANRQVITYWVMDAAPRGTLSMTLTNLDTGLRMTPDTAPVEGDSAWRTRAWRVLLTFPEPGCWQVVVTRGGSTAVLWLQVAPGDLNGLPQAPLPQLELPAGPLPVEALRDLGPGEALQFWVDIRADIRSNAGNLLEWQVAGVERVLPDGTRQQHLIARDESGQMTAEFVSDGERWWWWQHGWVEAGAHATGILAPPADLQLSESQLRLVRRALAEPADLEIIAERSELSSTDEIRVTRYRLHDMAWLGRDLGIVVSDAYLETHVTTAAPQRVLQARTVLVAADGSEHVLVDQVMRSFILTTAADVDERLFAVPEESPGDALRYAAPTPDLLPAGVSITSHIRLFPGAQEEVRLLDETSGTAMALIISPSRGGLDPRGLIRQAERLGELVATTASTRAGQVTWLTQPGDGTLVHAVWDDGTYRFELSGLLPGWEAADLVPLVEALSWASVT
jgi:hypothetical protein